MSKKMQSELVAILTDLIALPSPYPPGTSVEICAYAAQRPNLGRNLTPLPKPKADAQLVTSGLFAWIRHPIYSALMLLTFGSSLERGHLIALILSACLAVLLEFKSRREESWLLEQFPEYAAYRSRVKKFLPGIY